MLRGLSGEGARLDNELLVTVEQVTRCKDPIAPLGMLVGDRDQGTEYSTQVAERRWEFPHHALLKLRRQGQRTHKDLICRTLWFIKLSTHRRFS